MTQSNFRSIWKMKNRVVVNWSRITGLKITRKPGSISGFFFYFHTHLKLLKDIRPVDKHAGIIWRRPADEAPISNLGASCWSLPKLPSDQQVMPKVWTLITLCPSHDHQVSFEDIFFFHFMENNLISLKLIFRFCVLLWFSNVYWKEKVFYLSLLNHVM